MRSKAGYIIVTQLSSFKNKKRITVPLAITKKKKRPQQLSISSIFFKDGEIIFKIESQSLKDYVKSSRTSAD